MKPAAHNGSVLAILFILWGCLHLAVGAFWWSIIFGLAQEGYTDVLLDLKTSIALALTITMVVPLVSGIALLRAGRWSGGAVLVTCVVILIVTFIVLRQFASPRLSTARIVFGALYGGANLAIVAYGLCFVNRRRTAQSSSLSKT